MVTAGSLPRFQTHMKILWVLHPHYLPITSFQIHHILVAPVACWICCRSWLPRRTWIYQVAFNTWSLDLTSTKAWNMWSLDQNKRPAHGGWGKLIRTSTTDLTIDDGLFMGNHPFCGPTIQVSEILSFTQNRVVGTNERSGCLMIHSDSNWIPFQQALWIYAWLVFWNICYFPIYWE